MLWVLKRTVSMKTNGKREALSWVNPAGEGGPDPHPTHPVKSYVVVRTPLEKQLDPGSNCFSERSVRPSVKYLDLSEPHPITKFCGRY